jgi:hypothetical protein
MSTTLTPQEISAMTPDQATAALAERAAAYRSATPAGAEPQVDKLTADPAWRERYLAGGLKERNEMAAALTAKLGGGDQLDHVIAGTAPVPEFETVTEGALTTYKQMQAAADLRGLGISDAAIRELFEGNNPATRAQYDAVMRLAADLESNPEWRARYFKGKREAVRQMTLINMIKVGVKVGGFKEENAAA